MKVYCRKCGYEVDVGYLKSRVFCPECGSETAGARDGGCEIVKCRDCKWCDSAGRKRALICTNPYIDVDAHPDFYCGYGERRSNGKES